MSFDVSAAAYGKFMGRFSEPLADKLVELASVVPGDRALDVGCGPGALTARLVARLGVEAVTAIDPSESFVAATAARFPGIDVRAGVAEALPYADAEFDVAMAQLVVHFMADPVAGLTEMARVTRPGGRIAACVWDHAGGSGPLSTFWQCVRALDPAAPGEAELAGTREGHLAELAEAARLRGIEPGRLTVDVPFAEFQDWWEPYTFGVGPAGAYVAALDDSGREALRAECERVLPPAPFTLSASAWSVVARA